MKDKYILWLEELGVYPINDELWNQIEVNHRKPENHIEQKNTEVFIKEKLGNKNGLYIYQSLDQKTLYIGKGAPIANRLISHYRECFQPVPGDTKEQRWHKFFQSNSGPIKIYWKEMEGENERKIVEKLLDNVLSPMFNGFICKERINSYNGESTTELNNCIKKDKRIDAKNDINYEFGDYNENLIYKVALILGDNFKPCYRKTGVTFFDVSGKRILKIVRRQKFVEIEFNTPVPENPGVKVLSNEEAIEKKMGTCRWIYKGEGIPSNLIEEARRKFSEESK